MNDDLDARRRSLIDPRSQYGRMLAMLRRGPKTTIDFHAAYILAPSARISGLRDLGFSILTTRLKNRVAKYSLIRSAKAN